MAYLYRGAQSPREEGAFANFSSNPLSPPRNPNRLSGGMMNSNDARGPLTRRFTTNALPTLSPIGQQRRQAAGDTQMVSAVFPTQSHKEHKESKEGHENGMVGYCISKQHGDGGVCELFAGEQQPVRSKEYGMEAMFNGARIGTSQQCTASFSRSIEEKCSGSNHEDEKAARGGVRGAGRGRPLFWALEGNIWLTPHEQPSGAYSRVGPVSLTISIA